ncbi:actin-related protein 6-like isoform X1 [Biomphalaria glabrata]|uniref:Actin-related protein 6 n=1 Tax=Biomphalaria glabrata TaxID=6526 RepID=A0A2C9JZ22_BIOGL|nr:actin-related protein 6-like isoform X1 [Biomphalaria glabrata]KAI8752843.1 actin-related protein 6 isoform X1 [Biomphalaria glabrata]
MATLILDNGAGTAKVGFSTDSEPKIIPNCVTKAKNVRTRIFIGDQIEECKDLSSLYYLLPFQKGFLVNWEIEKQVWDHMFSKDVCQVDFNETALLVTEPFFNFPSIGESINEVIFEEYQFQALHRTQAPTLSCYKHQTDKVTSGSLFGTLVVDSGYSFSHIVPFYKNKPLKEAIIRVNVGGKVLTNHLKEVISYRQLMVMDETYVINQMKEDVCYVSTQFKKDISIARLKYPENTISRDYILPDYTHIKRGYVRAPEDSGKAKGDEQMIRMNNERFAIPELLFYPSDVGIQEMGLSESIMHCMTLVDKELVPHLLNNIVLTGGNALLPGFQDRIFQDVRSMASDDYDVGISTPTNPLTYAWQSGCDLALDPIFPSMCVSRHDYEEHGHVACINKFNVS